MKAINILWDTDGADISLPAEIQIPPTITDPDEISDYLSVYTGYCHYGFKLVTDDCGMRIISLEDVVDAVYMLNPGEVFSVRDYDIETDSGYWYGFQRLTTGLDTDIIIFGIHGGDGCMEIIDFGTGRMRISYLDLKDWIASILDDRCIEEIWIDEEDWEDNVNEIQR